MYNKEVKETKTTPDDGFVHKKDINPLDMESYGKYFKGYSTSKIVSTNDTRITKPFVNVFSMILIIIGILCLLSMLFKVTITSIILGLAFVSIGLFLRFKGNKDISKIEAKYKSNSNYNEDLSSDVRKEYVDNLKNQFDISRKNTFTKQNYKWFKRYGLIFSIIIDILAFIFLSMLVNIIMGIFILIVFVLVECLYFTLVSKLFK